MDFVFIGILKKVRKLFKNGYNQKNAGHTIWCMPGYGYDISK